MSDAADLRSVSGAQRAILMAERRSKIADLIARGRTLREAAAEMGITFGQATAAYRAVLQDVERGVLRNVEKHRSRALAKVLQLQREAWEAYERSKRGSVEQEGIVEDGKPSTTSRVRRASALQAEAKFLETIRRLLEDERKLLGLDKADPPAPKPGVVIERGIVIVNEAGLPDSNPWLATIAPGIARQGIGLLPPGTTDAEVQAISPRSSNEQPERNGVQSK